MTDGSPSSLMATHRRPALVLVNGHPATGKSRLAEYLGRELQMPVLSKDRVKEQLLASLGDEGGSREWSHRVGAAAIEVMFAEIEALLAAGCSLVVDCNLDPWWHDERIRRLEVEYGCQTVQIVLFAPGDVLLARYSNRREVEPDLVHRELDAADREALAKPPVPVAIAGATLHVDTTEFDAVSYEEIRRTVDDALTPGG